MKYLLLALLSLSVSASADWAVMCNNQTTAVDGETKYAIYVIGNGDPENILGTVFSGSTLTNPEKQENFRDLEVKVESPLKFEFLSGDGRFNLKVEVEKLLGKGPGVFTLDGKSLTLKCEGGKLF